MTTAQINALVTDYITAEADGNMLADGNFTATCFSKLLMDGRNSFVTLDDTNELIHAVRINDDQYTQVKYPFEISSVSYDKIIMLKGYFSMAHLEAAIDTILGTNISATQKTQLLKWAKSVNINQNVAPNETRPYFKDEPNIQGKYYPPEARDDLASGDVVYDQGGFTNP